MKKKQKIILYVEDSKINNENTTRFLERQGYFVLSYFFPEKVVEDLNNELMFDIAIIDRSLNSKKISGDDLIKLVRERNPKSKIICASGFNPLLDLKEDMYCFLEKPYRFEELNNVLERLL